MLKELFVNLTILITFNYLFTHLFKERLVHKKDSISFQAVKGLACGLLGVILMVFGFTYQHSIIDLRNIPIMIAALYGGWVSTATALAMITAGRLLITMNTSALYSVVIICIAAIPSLIVSRRKKVQLKHAFYLLIITNSLISFSFYFLIDLHSYELHLYFWIISIAGGMLSLYIIDHETNAHLLFKQYKFQAHFDFLTGVYNRRKFEETTKALYQQAADTPHFQFALIYMDIDHFKTINDQYGHHEGDQVLKELGLRLKQSIRNTDPAARIGGEEFAVLLPNCSLDKAARIAERIRSTVSDAPIVLTNGEELSVTISLGAAHYPNNTEQPGSLPILADQMLYKAKETGRNRVCFSEKKE
ncbi:diguanylate cyclase DgcK [Bacillus subtilis]|uniref:GGDEF domain-containing protein n=1 Tax=Bacillus subtilis TaxID=1423 RepID=UPI001C23575F|nr:GGDEF domain-containing protein [Bacillus subtilis]MBU8570271.1 diguanylate cyclase DgcK [Bacillus subtilis]MBU8623090.1 diguanylate cyclase DgcK [Bacillus subtilis]MCY9209024.1 diguanylate cyclase DgcK [Bacillus subtilis]MEC1582753.1 diguanylate cyclase DgcK [Bacillus subtilis]MED1807141.1 diguanylate cyclase DgcK [Bacillus subtilis]